jgi:flagellum-specific peptidoglycan hydrolase FlgJ
MLKTKHILIATVIAIAIIYLLRKPIKKTAMETAETAKKFVVRKTTYEPFLNKYSQFAKEAEKITGVPALVTLAQAALESGWGKSAPKNNFFGHKAQSTWKGERQLLTTSEILPSSDKSEYNFPSVISVKPFLDSSGKQRRNSKNKLLFRWVVKDNFRAYNSPLEAFVAHGNFIKNNQRYKKAFQTTTPENFAIEVAKAGYATDPNYSSKLLNLISLFKNT